MRLVLLAALLLAFPALAQRVPPQPPPDVLEAVRKTGAVLNPKMVQDMVALYAPRVRGPGPDVRVQEDLAYGPHERQRLDLYTPVNRPHDRIPTVLFVHGGGFVGGNKSSPDSPFHRNVGAYFVRHGLIGAVMTYRLAPQAAWPSGGEDVAAALGLLRRTVFHYGGDPERIVVVGHSAGATHVAHYLFDTQLQPQLRQDGVIGAVLVSGIFDPVGGPSGPGVEAYYGADRSKWADRAPILKAGKRLLPLLLVTAEFDPPVFVRESERLEQAVCELKGRCPRTQRLPGHNHLTEMLQVGAPGDSMGPALLKFVRSLN